LHERSQQTCFIELPSILCCASVIAGSIARQREARDIGAIFPPMQIVARSIANRKKRYGFMRYFTKGIVRLHGVGGTAILGREGAAQIHRVPHAGSNAGNSYKRKSNF